MKENINIILYKLLLFGSTVLIVAGSINKLYSNNTHYADQQVKEIPFSGGESLFEILTKQLGEHKLSEKKKP